MAKKKKKNEDPFVQAQKLANNSAVTIQKLANKTTEKSFSFNKEEAENARDWQKMMSDTAHQREVKDLQEAGLNPVLSANSGAQSYTTSSASAQATDASSSIAGLYGSAMSSAANRYSADKSAAAQLKASRQQAAAARYAAQQSAAAQKYAADRSAEVQKYKAYKDYQIKKYQTDNQRPSTVVGLFDKLAEKFGVYKGATNQLNKQAKSLDRARNDKQFMSDPKKDWSYQNINDHMKKDRLDPMLKTFGVHQNDLNRRILFNAVYNNNKTAQKTVQSWYDSKYKHTNTREQRNLDRYWQHH